jgi:tetratricopeptide (TPR) repeat protein
MRKADALLCMDKPEQSLQSLRQTLEILRNPKDEKEKHKKAQALTNIGVIFVCMQKEQHAVNAFKEAIILHPNLLHAVFNLTLLFFKLKKDEEACRLWLSSRRIPLTEQPKFYDMLITQLASASATHFSVSSHVNAEIPEVMKARVHRLALSKWRMISANKKIVQLERSAHSTIILTE